MMHYTFQLPEFLVQNSLSAPTQVFQECKSEPPPASPPPPNADFVQILALWVESVWTTTPPPTTENADLDRSWHFGLSWSGPKIPTPPPKNADLDRSWHFGLSWSGPPPPPHQFQGAHMWRPIAVSPVDTISFSYRNTHECVQRLTTIPTIRSKHLFCVW